MDTAIVGESPPLIKQLASSFNLILEPHRT